MKNSSGKYTRRDFLVKSAAGVASAGTTSAGVASAGTTSAGVASFGFINSPDRISSIIPSDQQDKPAGKIISRTLGKTGLKIPVISMGVMNTDDIPLLRNSYNTGIRLFDTAAIYGNGENEELIGRFLKKYGLRDKIVLQTKILHPVGAGYGRSRESLSNEEVKKAFLKKFEGSMRRLKAGYVDILFYHSADNVYRLNDPGIHSALGQIKKEGKARFLGVSTHGKVVREAADSGIFDVILTQINFTMDDDTKLIEAIDYAASKNIGVIGMKAHGGNRLAGGIVNHTAALKWVLRHKSISTVISGYTNAQQLKENFSVAYNLEYSEDEKKFLSDRNIKYGMNFCRLCGFCRGDCPNGVNIPVLMRTHMYAAGYGNFLKARENLLSIPLENGLDKCISCCASSTGACVAKCRYIANIPANINELKLIYG